MQTRRNENEIGLMKMLELHLLGATFRLILNALHWVALSETKPIYCHRIHNKYTHTDAQKPNGSWIGSNDVYFLIFVFSSPSFLICRLFKSLGISDLGNKIEPYVWWKDVFCAIICSISGKFGWELRVIERAMSFVSNIFAQLSSFLLRWDDFVSMQPLPCNRCTNDTYVHWLLSFGKKANGWHC